MTKYILAGGNDLHFNTYGTRVADEVYKSRTRPLRMISCFFATPPEFWETKAAIWRPWFEQYFGEDIIWQYAKPEDFIDRLRWSDLVYLHGGDNDLLRVSLDQFPELKKHFSDKVVVASSAGANYLSQHFWRRRQQEIWRGRGIVPCNIMVHYGVNEPNIPETDWEEARMQLAAFDGDEPLKLREGHFKVFEL